MDKVSYDKSIYSLALIDIDLFLESLKNLEAELKDATENMELVLSNQGFENSVSILEKHCLLKFKKFKTFLSNMRNKIEKYEKNLNVFFSKNLITKQTFELKSKVLNELIFEKESFIAEEIIKCEKFIAEKKDYESIEKQV